jgi:hypothetical protein
MLGQAFNRYDPWGTATEWDNISPLFIRKQGDQVLDPRNYPKGAHLTHLIIVWKPNHAYAEERWDLVTLHRLLGPK